MNKFFAVQKWIKSGKIRFATMTGYTIRIFNDLLPYFEDAHNFYFNSYEVNGKRKSNLEHLLSARTTTCPQLHIGLRLS